MKIVINNSYGAITLESDELRRDPKFIEDVESGRFVGCETDAWGSVETLRVVEIPDNATDMMIVNYDGVEGVLYVVDGMIHYTPDDNDFRRIFSF